MGSNEVQMRYPVTIGLHFKDYPWKPPKPDTLIQMEESLVAELAKAPKPVPGVRLSQARREGFMDISIDDQASYDWFKKIVPQLKPKGLKFGPITEVLRYRVFVEFPESVGKLTYDKILKMVAQQNDISTDAWSSNLQNATKLWRQKQVLFIDENSLKIIRGREYVLKCGIEDLYFEDEKKMKKSVVQNKYYQ